MTDNTKHDVSKGMITCDEVVMDNMEGAEESQEASRDCRIITMDADLQEDGNGEGKTSARDSLMEMLGVGAALATMDANEDDASETEAKEDTKAETEDVKSNANADGHVDADGFREVDNSGTVTFEMDIRVDPSLYTSPNYIPLPDDADPAQAQLPKGYVGLEEIVSEVSATEGPTEATAEDAAEEDYSIGRWVAFPDARMSGRIRKIKEGPFKTKEGPVYLLEASEIDEPLFEEIWMKLDGVKSFETREEAEAHKEEEEKRRRDLLEEMLKKEDEAAEAKGCCCTEDEAIAMDAEKAPKGKPRINCKTTFEDCKAKNPLLCPWHGSRLLKMDIEAQLKGMGLNGAVKVGNMEGKKGREKGKYFSVSITVPIADKDRAKQILKAFLKTPGISSAKLEGAEHSEYAQGNKVELEEIYNTDLFKVEEPPSEQGVDKRVAESVKKGEEVDTGESTDDGDADSDDREDDDDDNRPVEGKWKRRPTEEQLEAQKRRKEMREKRKEEQKRREEEEKRRQEEERERKDEEESGYLTKERIQEMRDAIREFRENETTGTNYDKVAVATANKLSWKLDSLRIAQGMLEAYKVQLAQANMANNATSSLVKSMIEANIAEKKQEISTAEGNIERLYKEFASARERLKKDYRDAMATKLGDVLSGYMRRMVNEFPMAETEKSLWLDEVADAANKELHIDEEVDAEELKAIRDDTEFDKRYIEFRNALEKFMPYWQNPKKALENVADHELKYMVDNPTGEIGDALEELLTADYQFGMAYANAHKALAEARARRMSRAGGDIAGLEELTAVIKPMGWSIGKQSAWPDGSMTIALDEVADAHGESGSMSVLVKDGKIGGYLVKGTDEKGTQDIFGTLEEALSAHSRIYGYERKNRPTLHDVPLEDALSMKAVTGLLPTPSEMAKFAEEVGPLSTDHGEELKKFRNKYYYSRVGYVKAALENEMRLIAEKGSELAHGALDLLGFPVADGIDFKFANMPNGFTHIAGKVQGVLSRLFGVVRPQGSVSVRMMGSLKGRAQCVGGRRIDLGRLDGIKTWAHEMGHSLQDTNPHISKRCVEFLEMRTKGESMVQLKKLFPGHGYKRYEVTRPDKFFHAYCGKQYGYGQDSRPTEILSMGIERLMLEPDKFIAEDPQYVGFVMGILKGVL